MYFITFDKERQLRGFRFDVDSTPDGPRLVALWTHFAKLGVGMDDALGRLRFAVRFQDLLHTCLWRFAYNDALDVTASLTLDVPAALAAFDWGRWQPLGAEAFLWLPGETLFYPSI